MLKKFMINCDEATTICDKSQYNEASFVEKLKLNFHLLMCKYCSLYSAQNKILTLLFKTKSKECQHKTHVISSQEKETLKKKLKEQTI